MKAIEIVAEQGWRNLWIESDSLLVVLAFKKKSLVPWKTSNHWKNCLDLCKNMNVFISHVYREDNSCANALANLGLTIANYTFWNTLPVQIDEYFGRYKLGMPRYRFSIF